MRCSPDPSRAQAGFTLIEMLVVVGVLSVALLAAATALDVRLLGGREGDVAARVSEAIKTARIRAAAEGAPVTVALSMLDLGGSRARACGGAELSELVVHSDGVVTALTFCVHDGQRERRFEIDWLTGRVAEAR